MCRSPRRGQERAGGFPHPDGSVEVRVGARRAVVLYHHTEDSGSSSGSVYDVLQSYIGDLRLPKLGPRGVGHGRDVFRLKPLGSDLPVPSGGSLEESPSQALDVQGDYRRGGSHLALKQVVSHCPRTPAIHSASAGPNALSIVQQRPVYASSWLTDNLRLLIFSSMPSINHWEFYKPMCYL